MISDGEPKPGSGGSEPSEQAGSEQDPTKRPNSPPKEGSNRGFEVDENARANIDDSISGRPPKSHSDHADDGHPGETKVEDDEA